MRKRMIMMIVAAFAAVFVGSPLRAENVVKAQSFATVAGKTVTTNYIELATHSVDYREISKVVARNNGAQTATINLDICDKPAAGYAYGVYTDLATLSLATGATTNSFPVRAGTYGSTTNVACYEARELRAIITLAATNSTQANIDFYIYGRK